VQHECFLLSATWSLLPVDDAYILVRVTAQLDREDVSSVDGAAAVGASLLFCLLVAEVLAANLPSAGDKHGGVEDRVNQPGSKFMSDVGVQEKQSNEEEEEGGGSGGGVMGMQVSTNLSQDVGRTGTPAILTKSASVWVRGEQR
jgi:hypothetical protein